MTQENGTHPKYSMSSLQEDLSREVIVLPPEVFRHRFQLSPQLQEDPRLSPFAQPPASKGDPGVQHLFHFQITRLAVPALSG